MALYISTLAYGFLLSIPHLLFAPAHACLSYLYVDHEIFPLPLPHFDYRIYRRQGEERLYPWNCCPIRGWSSSLEKNVNLEESRIDVGELRSDSFLSTCMQSFRTFPLSIPPKKRVSTIYSPRNRPPSLSGP
jgi:hypothetical protein